MGSDYVDTGPDEVGVIVYENPVAAAPFPDDLFRGKWDTRYKLTSTGVTRMFATQDLLNLEAVLSPMSPFQWPE